MCLPRSVVGIFSFGLMVLGADVVSGQDYPNKPVRLVTGTVGGGSDFVARLLAQGLTESMGQQMIVDNRPSGIIPVEVVAKAAADGYTVLVAGSTVWMTSLMQKTSYDVLRDLSPITATSSSSNILVVHPSLPVKSVKDLIALAKARPGELNYSSGASASSNHLAAELFKSMAGVNIVRIPYKGSGLALFAAIGGETQLMFSPLPPAMPHVKSGKLRALGITSAQPSALVPGAPTVAASGLPGYELVTLDVLFAPAKTPAALINRLHQEIVRFINRTESKETFFNSGLDLVASSPADLASKIKSEIVIWTKVIKDIGLQAD